MSDADQTRDTWQQRVEQRIDQLEDENETIIEENKELKAELEQQQDGGLPNVSRRQTLAGLLGGGAMLGAAGSASAQPGNGNGGPPFADEAHDHSGDYLGEGEPVERIDVNDINASSVTADQIQSVRMLSSFDTLQAALNYSSANNAAIFVDGVYKTDETNVSIPPDGPGTVLVGNFGWSEIVYTGSAREDFLVYSPERYHGMVMRWEGFTVRNAGNGRKAFTPGDVEDGFGFIGTASHFENIKFEDWNGVYPIEFKNAYGVTFASIAGWFRQSEEAYGGFRFQNCNSCNFIQLRVLRNTTKGNKTPMVYVKRCYGTLFTQPYVEKNNADALMQISDGSSVTITQPYFEEHGADDNCAFQIGDGGITKGNTDGTTRTSYVRIFGGFVHHRGGGDAVRLLNVEGFQSYGLRTGYDYVNDFNVAGSTSDDEADLTTSVYLAVVDAHMTTGHEPVVNPGPAEQFVYRSGKESTSPPTVSDLVTYEVRRGKGTGPNGEDELFYKATPDRITRFTGDATITQ